MKLLVSIFALIIFSLTSFLHAQDTVRVVYGDTTYMNEAQSSISKYFKLKEDLSDGYYKVTYNLWESNWYCGKLIKGKKEGKWTEVALGKIVKIESFKNGVQSGEQIEFYENGQLKSKYFGAFDESCKPQYYYNYDSLLSSVSFPNNLAVIGFFPDMTVSGVSCKNPELNLFIDIEYFPNGRIKKKSIRNPESTFYHIIVYDPEGQIIQELKTKNE